MSGVFVNVNRGKRAITADLRSESGKSALRALVEQADVFIHSMRSKAINRLGFSYPEVAAINPASSTRTATDTAGADPTGICRPMTTPSRRRAVCRRPGAADR
ncbi:coA-transferase III family protein [Mycobacterium kansasii]|uniref:CoA-transferase III family protein n=1 Tax=Mycobacterium kansasii TaxID=1768 RepID=A0A1V3W8V5_MYCKA|nr:coA-transferase III family protein [Mycobacterium kansasii]